MRGHWKPGGGFPLPLFLLETGVSLLCAVPCLEILYQEERRLEQELAAVQGNRQHREDLGSRCPACPASLRPCRTPEPWDPSLALALGVLFDY